MASTWFTAALHEHPLAPVDVNQVGGAEGDEQLTSASHDGDGDNPEWCLVERIDLLHYEPSSSLSPRKGVPVRVGSRSPTVPAVVSGSGDGCWKPTVSLSRSNTGLGEGAAANNSTLCKRELIGFAERRNTTVDILTRAVCGRRLYFGFRLSLLVVPFNDGHVPDSIIVTVSITHHHHRQAQGQALVVSHEGLLPLEELSVERAMDRMKTFTIPPQPVKGTRRTLGDVTTALGALKRTKQNNNEQAEAQHRGVQDAGTTTTARQRLADAGEKGDDGLRTNCSNEGHHQQKLVFLAFPAKGEDLSLRPAKHKSRLGGTKNNTGGGEVSGEGQQRVKASATVARRRLEEHPPGSVPGPYRGEQFDDGEDRCGGDDHIWFEDDDEEEHVGNPTDPIITTGAPTHSNESDDDNDFVRYELVVGPSLDVFTGRNGTGQTKGTSGNKGEEADEDCISSNDDCDPSSRSLHEGKLLSVQFPTKEGTRCPLQERCGPETVTFSFAFQEGVVMAARRRANYKRGTSPSPPIPADAPQQQQQPPLWRLRHDSGPTWNRRLGQVFRPVFRHGAQSGCEVKPSLPKEETTTEDEQQLNHFCNTSARGGGGGGADGGLAKTEDELPKEDYLGMEGDVVTVSRRNPVVLQSVPLSAYFV